jgi:hypothetical protein
VWAWPVHTYAEQHPNRWYPIAAFRQYWHFFLSHVSSSSFWTGSHGQGKNIVFLVTVIVQQKRAGVKTM